MRKAARVDRNQAEIIAALRAAGCVVWPIQWPVDLLVRVGSKFVPIEVKDGKKPPSAQALTPDQVAFFESAGDAPVAVVNSVEAALRAVAAIKKGTF